MKKSLCLFTVLFLSLLPSLALANNNLFTPSVAKGNLPVIWSISPNHGPKSGGNEVILSGSYLDPVTEVYFGGQLAPFRIISSSEIVCEAPQHSIYDSDVVDVTLISPVGKYVLPNAYIYDPFQ